MITNLLGKIEGLSFAQLANVQTVGIGLYLALGVIQAVSSGGVAALRRRATTLQTAVHATRTRTEFPMMHQLQSEVSGLEIGFQSLNRTILWAVGCLFTISVFYFSYCTIYQDLKAGLSGTLFVVGFYLVLPIVIFAVSAFMIGRRCYEIEEKVRAAEKRWMNIAF